MFFSSLKMFRWASIILLHPIPIWNFQSLEIISPEWKQRQNWLLLHGSFCGSNNTVKMGEEEEGYYIVFHPRDYEEDAFAA